MKFNHGVIACAIAALLLLSLGFGYGLGTSNSDFVLEALETPWGNVTLRSTSRDVVVQSAPDSKSESSLGT